MNNQQKVLLTQEGLDQLNKEYNQLVEVKRPEMVKRLAIAREQGDLAENSEYAAAREELNLVDGRIFELEEILKHAQIITSTHTKNAVEVGCRVTLHINGKREIFAIVGEWEADPKEKKISHSSPLGKALLGKKVGDQIEVEAPVGKINYKILHIE